MKSSVTNTECWWAVEDSNLRPPRCQRLPTPKYRDKSTHELSKIGSLLTEVRKSAQVVIRKLRSPLCNITTPSDCEKSTSATPSSLMTRLLCLSSRCSATVSRNPPKMPSAGQRLGTSALVAGCYSFVNWVCPPRNGHSQRWLRA